MKLLKTYFHSLRRSFDPSYYRDILKAPLSFSLKFFFLTCLIYGFISAATVSTAVMPEVNKFAAKLKDQAYTLYPKDLEITIKDKKLSINQEVPYFIPINYKDWFNQTVPDTTINNLMVIDTNSDNPTADIRQYQTLAFLTADSLAFRGENNEIRVFPLDQTEISNANFNYSIYKQALDKLTPYLKYLSGIVSGATAIFFLLFLPLSKLSYLAFFSLFAVLVSRLVKPKLSYRQCFQIGLHAFILPTLVTDLLHLLAIRIPIPFFSSIILLIWFLLILSKLEQSKMKSPPAVKPAK